MLRYAVVNSAVYLLRKGQKFRFNPQIPLKKWREPLCFCPMQLRYMARWWMSPVECWINETEITGGIVMSLDTYYTLGRSGLRVSRLALGTMTFGTDGAGEYETARQLFNTYVDAGGSFIDTADLYKWHQRNLAWSIHRRPPTARAHRCCHQV